MSDGLIRLERIGKQEQCHRRNSPTFNAMKAFQVRWVLLFPFLLAVLSLPAQTPAEWARTVNWDGYTHWSNYIRSVPRYMGPNALPIPFIGNGTTDSSTWIGTSLQGHFMSGDRTLSTVLYGNYCLVKELVSLDLSFIPVEYYRMSDALKKERHVYYVNYNESRARGDVFVNTRIRLLKRWEQQVQLALRIGFRLPASSGLGAARFSDAMGYYVDVSAGKPLSHNWKWIAMAGIYVWQMEGVGYRQNDAFLFGTGLEWNHRGWLFQGYAAGYLGYMYGTGDKPIVLRSQLEKRSGNHSFVLRLQQGIQDFRYSSVEVGARHFVRHRPFRLATSHP
ncbi:MAG: hypothetical protein RJA57_1398 [Bacteroidota bacterium]